MTLTLVAAAALVAELFYFFVLANFFLMSRVRKDSEVTADISVFKPLKGVSPYLRENIVSFLKLESPGRLQIIFAVENQYDPVLNLLDSILVETSTEHEIVVIRGIAPRGKNPKNSNLLAAREVAKYPWIYVSDADVSLPANHLRKMVAVTNGKSGHYVTSLPLARRLDGLAANLMGVVTNLDGVQYFAICQLFKRPLIFGGSSLFSRKLDNESKALDRCSSLVTDDISMSDSFRRAEGVGNLLSEPVNVSIGSIEFKALFNTWLRWLVITRTMAPRLFWIAPLTWWWQAAMLTGIILGSVAFLKLAILFFALRSARCFLILFFAGEKLPNILLQCASLPIYDLLIPFFWTKACFAQRVYFGGRWLEVNRVGEIQ